MNQTAWKRKVCVRKAQGDTSEAIKELSRFVQVFSGDEAAWVELSELYISSAQYAMAKFCFEELILIKPENYLFHLQYAEVLYTLGGKKDFETARQYYAQSLELKPENNLRALYGLCLCLRTKASNRALHVDLYKWSVDQVLDLYRQSSSPHLQSLVEPVLKLSIK